jgi:hypothetical protein
MLQGLIGSLFDKEQIVSDTIQETLERVANELSCTFKDLFVMIKPFNDEFNFKCYIYRIDDGVPKLIREIPLSEILGQKSD